jgi:hypothetical protein
LNNLGGSVGRVVSGGSDPVQWISVAELISHAIKARLRRAARRPISRPEGSRPARKRPGR